MKPRFAETYDEELAIRHIRHVADHPQAYPGAPASAEERATYEAAIRTGLVDRLRAQGYRYFAIEDIQKDQVVGVISLAPVEDPQLGQGYDLGIAIFDEYQQLGWARASLVEFVHWWRGTHQGCGGLMATISPDNPDHSHVHYLLTKAGFADLHDGSYYLPEWQISKSAADAVGKLGEVLQQARAMLTDASSASEDSLELMEFLHKQLCDYLDYRTSKDNWREERTLRQLSGTYSVSEATRDAEFVHNVNRLSWFRADLAMADASENLFLEWGDAISELKDEFDLE